MREEMQRPFLDIPDTHTLPPTSLTPAHILQKVRRNKVYSVCIRIVLEYGSMCCGRQEHWTHVMSYRGERVGGLKGYGLPLSPLMGGVIPRPKQLTFQKFSFKSCITTKTLVTSEYRVIHTILPKWINLIYSPELLELVWLVVQPGILIYPPSLFFFLFFPP